MCGGTATRSPTWASSSGLSPRVRGNRVQQGRHQAHPRSIPACAGEPYLGPFRVHPGRVYPRVCGGTAPSPDPGEGGPGLSPRVRGNPAAAPGGTGRAGSIPACAGEPPCIPPHTPIPAVYPRVCGGTKLRKALRWLTWGLSPRVRGNRGELLRPGRHAGSIPACAGEPGESAPTPASAEVYPRVCGGTYPFIIDISSLRGLSPRVRGNPVSYGHATLHPRSIPACAGEPSSR